MRRRALIAVVGIALLAAACGEDATQETTEWTGTVVRVQVTTSTTLATTTTSVPSTTTTAEPFEPTPEMLALVGTYSFSTIFFQLSAHGVIAHGSSLDTMTRLGKWHAEGTTLTISDLDLGPEGCGDAVGAFRYTLSGSQLRLTVVDDPCAFRGTWFTRSFSRLP